MKREVLVRYLDAWTPVVLRSPRPATYVESGGSAFAADALRVFSEFADRLDGHHLDMVIIGPPTPLGEPPAGLSVRFADLPPHAVAGPLLAHIDLVEDSALTEPDAMRWAASLGKAHEVLLTLPTAADHRARVAELGLPCTVAVELVADDGTAQLLVFATGDSRHLTTFKNELWAADEFAGIRYRDPNDAERHLIDISLTPQLPPLRTALLAELARRGSCTVAELREHTLLATIYRPADAIGALTSAAATGAIAREPAKGRLTPRTRVSHRD